MYQFEHFFRMFSNFLTDVLILIRFQHLDDVINHFGIEHTVLLENVSVGAQFIGRLPARSRQLGQAFHFGFVFCFVNIDIHVSFLSELESTLHFETMAGSHAQTSQEQVNVG